MTETLLLYSLKSALVLSLLFIPYMLMLRKESFFQLNRCVLLTIIFLSLTLPLMNLHFLSIEDQPVVQAARSQMIDIGIPLTEHAITLPEVSISASETEGSTSWFSILAIIFCIMASFILLWRMWQIMGMKRAVRRGSLWHQEENGIHIYCHATDIAPYSWMNNIVISQKDYQENAREILLHEKAHIKARHSWDIIFLSFLEVIQWWNPLVYIMGSSLRDVHEYEADESVLAHGVSAKAYQLLLINKAVGASSYTFANSLNHSLILKRITMMQKSKSSWWMRAKVLYILPMATAALSAFATSESTFPQEEQYAELRNKITEKLANSKISQELPIEDITSMGSDTTPVSSLAEASPQTEKKASKSKDDDNSIVLIPTHSAMYKEGQEELMKYINKNIKYPAIAQQQGVQGRVIIKFTIEKDGSITDITTIRFSGADIPEVPSSEAAAIVIKTYKAQGKKYTPEQEEATKQAIQAMIDEAIRVTKSMPKWEPAYRDKEKKQPCRTKFCLPFVFRLA